VGPPYVPLDSGTGRARHKGKEEVSYVIIIYISLTALISLIHTRHSVPILAALLSPVKTVQEQVLPS